MEELKFTNKKIPSIVIAVLYFGFMIFVKFSGDILLKVFSVEFLTKYLDALFYIVLFVSSIALFRKIFCLSFKDFKDNWKKYLKWSIGFYFITFVLVGVVGMLLNGAEIDKSVNQSAVEWSIQQNKILFAISTSILGPVVEEVIYRGIVFNALVGEKTNTKRNILAIILTAVIFALMHVSFAGFTFSDLLANMPVFVIGLTLTFLYFKTGNILCPIIVHVIVNTVSVIAQLLS